MQTTWAVSLLLLVIIATEGSCTWVNLQDEAAGYIDNLRSTEEILSWDLTKNYSYWTEGHNRSGDHPIVGAVLSVTCDDRTTSEGITIERVPVRHCLEVYTWNISDGISSPFDLLVNVTVPMIRKNNSRQTFKVPVDFNNATQIVKKVHWVHSMLLRGRIRRLKKTCNFSAEITFNGRFAYEYYNKTGSCSAYQSVPVGNLSDPQKGLEYSDGQLKYTLKGTYEQIICRKRTKRDKEEA